jgi:hypothetical protein
VIRVYVDDLMITGASSEDIKKLKPEMAKVFHISDLGLLRYHLGIEVQHSAMGISLSQCAYALKILEKNGLIDCNQLELWFGRRKGTEASLIGYHWYYFSFLVIAPLFGSQ